jgi:hypothetical protein
MIDLVERVREIRVLLATIDVTVNELGAMDAVVRARASHNFPVNCRQVTFWLQNLKHFVPGGEAAFDAWYGPVQATMKADPDMRWFNELRTTIEHVGPPEVEPTMTFSGSFQNAMDGAPPGAIGWGMFDGFAQWSVATGDGTVEWVLAPIPKGIRISMGTEYTNRPGGGEVATVELCRAHLAKVRAIVDSFESTFL